MEYHVGRVRNADQERTRLNEILRDIQRRFSLTETQTEDLRRQIGGITGVSGIVTSVNGNTGDVTITIQSIGGVPATREINTTNSLTGGGNLSANRTLQLVGDVATPGPNQVYGTDGTGARGWKADPSAGGQVNSIVPRDGIDVDATDPANPEVSVLLSTDPGNTLSFGTDDGLFASGGGGGGDISGFVSVVLGAKGGPDLSIGDGDDAILAFDYQWTDWYLDVFPSAVDLVMQVSINGTPISTGGNPELVSATSAQGTTASWASDAGSFEDEISFEITALTGQAERVRLYLFGTRST